MPRAGRLIVLAVLVGNLLWTIPLTAVAALKWLGSDEPDVVERCNGMHTCYSGEAANRVQTLVVGGIALITLLILVVVGVRWGGQARTRKRLLANGTRVPARLVEVSGELMKVMGKPVRRLTFVAGAVRVSQSSAAVLPLGTPVTVAVDPTDPTKAVLVEDLDSLAATPRSSW
ncbi:DUF3592 domain-containing protein [Actinokineospora sp. NBRC 105648]|uniref:DUF3592 domain-containing protein n=1 Tax=Actinokineospora sp. NBRC 105648 TaxID=3032206 RepID=UPI0024A5DE79|nr:DUF3592 domain-containing protein [Actinokineospora sp. NBRC 105648]GLZ38496.1 hypothetical protein Acsp05_21200 [Actinokineospora sp. NBRC 105648]